MAGEAEFVNGNLLQSTLRELRGIAAARNLWLTFGAVVLLFALTGPFGTLEQMRFLPRLGYWLVLHGLAWSTALIFAVLGNVLLKHRLRSMLWRMMIGAIVAAVPIGAIIEFIAFAWFGHVPTALELLSQMLFAAPLCIIFCTITYMAMSSSGFPREDDANAQAASVAAAAPPAPLDEPIPLLRRLKPENRGRLQHLSVEDHYTLVTTIRGRELILLRFSDALAETGTTTGLQVHRSHWVADDFVAGVNRANSRISLQLADGTEIPVSRTYAASVRARFG